MTDHLDDRFGVEGIGWVSLRDLIRIAKAASAEHGFDFVETSLPSSPFPVCKCGDRLLECAIGRAVSPASESERTTDD